MARYYHVEDVSDVFKVQDHHLMVLFVLLVPRSTVLETLHAGQYENVQTS
jgi:hypothetical protein